MTWATMKQDDQRLVVHNGIPKLEQLQAAVGGLVDVSELRDDGLTMWVNDEGKLPWTAFGGPLMRIELENKRGTVLMQAAGWDDWTAGDVAFTGGPDSDGNTTSLTDEQITYLEATDGR